jgi:hypothetical protein
MLAGGCALLQPPPEPALESELPPAVEIQAPPAEVPALPPVAAIPAPPPAPVTPAPRSEVELLLEYFQRARELSGTELAREQERARSSFQRTGSDYDRMRLAMMLALPNAAGADEARALELLEPMVKNRSAALHPLAYMMSAFVHEQRRIVTNAQAMQRKLDQLRSLERTLIEREQAGQRRP